MNLRIITVLSALALAFPAAAQHLGDVAILCTEGSLTTHVWETDFDPRPERLFLAHFGETGVDRFIDEPGFEAEEGTLLPGSRLGWNAVAGLQRWEDGAFVPETDMRLEARFLSLAFTVGDAPVPGFELTVPAQGPMHRHLGFTLLDPTGAGPATGAYLLSLQLHASEGCGTSETFWILFNDGLADADFEAISAAAKDLLLPAACPGDLDASGSVDAGDIGSLLILFGAIGGPGDIDGNGTVDAADIGSMLILFGDCP
jgi:hypothetical protein